VDGFTELVVHVDLAMHNESCADDSVEQQAKIGEAEAFGTNLQQIQMGLHEGRGGRAGDCWSLTPWSAADEHPMGR
jgi:hypothetical protein